MLGKRDIERAISECESNTSSYQDCEKLATFYTIYDHLYADHNGAEEIFVGNYGDSDFLQSVNGKNAEQMWKIMNELVEAVMVTNPRLYESMMRKVTTL